MRTGPRIAALTLLSAVTVGAAAAQPPSAVVPNLVGTKRTQAETLLAQRKLRYKPARPSSRYELPAGATGTGDALAVVPEEQSPDRVVTGQDVPPGTPRWPGDRVEFSTSPLPAGSHRTPFPIELAATKVDTGGRALTVGLAPGEWADSCRPLDHVDVAPRARYLLLTPYVNVTDEAGPCASRARSVSLTLRRKLAGKPIVERDPQPPLDGLHHVAAVPWERVRLASLGHYAVTYFRGPDGCAVYSHATVTPRGSQAALTVFTGTTSESPNFCPLGRPRQLVLVRIPDMLVGRPLVDGASG
jgi:hypothetical protein